MFNMVRVKGKKKDDAKRCLKKSRIDREVAVAQCLREHIDRSDRAPRTRSEIRSRNQLCAATERTAVGSACSTCSASFERRFVALRRAADPMPRKTCAHSEHHLNAQ